MKYISNECHIVLPDYSITYQVYPLAGMVASSCTE